MRIPALIIATALVALTVLAQDAALERLNDSPRHHEWVEIPGDDRAIHTFVAYPETDQKAPVVLVIHENRGLNDWARGVADRLAEEGYIAVAPDLLSGMAPGGGNTPGFADTNAARDAIYELNDQQVMSELSSVTKWARSLSATSGKIAVAGFCWGGHQAFQFVTASELLEAAFVFYGTPPDDEELHSIAAPVYGFYGESDERVTSTVEETAAAMARTGNVFEPVIYENAGHGFMRSGEKPDADPGNVAARNAAWERWLKLLKDL